jgi:hypothetical protein
LSRRNDKDFERGHLRESIRLHAILDANCRHGPSFLWLARDNRISWCQALTPSKSLSYETARLKASADRLMRGGELAARREDRLSYLTGGILTRSRTDTIPAAWRQRCGQPGRSAQFQ